MYCSSIMKYSKVFVRDNFFCLSENEVGMKTKTVVTDIPLNCFSTDVSFCSTNCGDIMRYRYSISRMIAGTNQFLK